MIELLKAQLSLAAAMVRVASSTAERNAWAQYLNTVKQQLDGMQRPPRPERPPPDLRPPTRP